jgi:hypothetical protein
MRTGVNQSCQTMNKNLMRGQQSGKNWHRQALSEERGSSNFTVIQLWR